MHRERPRPPLARLLAVTVVAACALAAAVTTAAAPSAARQPRPVHVAPSTIDATGGRDVTAALLSFFASVPDGSTISFPAGARYRIEGSLRLEDRHDLVFDGNGATFFATTEADRNRRHWWILGGSRIVLRDMVVVGAHPNAGTGESAYRADREAQHGFDVAGTRGVEIAGVTVTDVYGDFVYLGMSGGEWVSDVWVHDSHFERNGRQGIALTGARRVLIERNTITETRRATFDLEPNGAAWGVEDVEIRDNRIGPGRLLFLASHGAGPVDRISVVGNRLEGRALAASFSAPEGTRRTGLRIVGNRADQPFGSPGGALIRISGYDGVEVSGNVQPLQRGRSMAGVRSDDVCHVAVFGNEFPDAVEEHRVAASGQRCPASSPRMLPAAPAGLPTEGGDQGRPPAPTAQPVPEGEQPTPPPPATAAPPATDAAPPPPATPPAAGAPPAPLPETGRPPADERAGEVVVTDDGADGRRRLVFVVGAIAVLALTWFSLAGALARRARAREGDSPP